MPEISVTVDDQFATSMSQVAAALRANGMQVSQVLEAIGVITGSIPSGGETALRGVQGVKSVDSALNIALPNPDSPVQ